MSYDYTRFGGMDALPTSQSQLESLQRLLAEKQERIQALEQQIAELERERGSLRLVFAARGIYWEDGADVPAIISHTLDLARQRYDERSQDVQKLVDAARPFTEAGINHPFTQHPTYTGKGCAICGKAQQAHELAEALKPFEQEKR